MASFADVPVFLPKNLRLTAGFAAFGVVVVVAGVAGAARLASHTAWSAAAIEKVAGL